MSWVLKVPIWLWLQRCWSTHKPFGLPILPDLSSALYADPCAIPSLDNLECSSLKRTLGISKALNNPLLCNPNDDFLFGKLPIELIYEILSYMSSTQVARLRLVCWNFALVASYENLPQSFWKSWFLLGHECDFIFPELCGKRDWVQLFQGIRSSLNATNPSLINQKRICSLLESIAVLTELDIIMSKEPHGRQFSLVEGEYMQFKLLDDNSAEHFSGIFMAMTSFSGQLALFSCGDQLVEGCCVKGYIFPIPNSRDWWIIESLNRQDWCCVLYIWIKLSVIPFAILWIFIARPGSICRGFFDWKRNAKTQWNEGWNNAHPA